MNAPHYDFVIVGSGFGGSVSALRLSEKGWRVLVIEKGRRFGPGDFPTANTQVRDWLWAPSIGARGPMKMTFFRHVTVLSGVGVGGGSLVYANTLPVPKEAFFQQGSWAGVADWRAELAPHYATAQRMLGANRVPFRTSADDVIAEVGRDLGREGHFHPTDVAVWFGEPGETVPDPYFDGEGPERTGCIRCGGCMLGCRHGAKNTLDKNYLWLAEKRGCTVLPELEVEAVRPRPEGGYAVDARPALAWLDRKVRTFTADRVVLAGGVLGTVDLLLRMKDGALPRLSERTGDLVRTNSESLIGVVSSRPDDLSKGIAIGSILHTDDHSHVEPVRYSEGGAELYKLMMAPHVPGDTLFQRATAMMKLLARDPRKSVRALVSSDLARQSIILLYMRSLEGTLRFRRGALGMTTDIGTGEPPRAFLPEASDIARRVAEKIDGVPVGLAPEFLLGTPSTAHILGGACIGANPDEGVIDADHQVYGYPGLYVIDGAAVSANPGVNPSLTITAMAERAMSRIAARA